MDHAVPTRSRRAPVMSSSRCGQDLRRVASAVLCLCALLGGLAVAPRAASASQDGGDLLETMVDGLNNRTWNAYNIRSMTGLPQVVGRPAVGVVGGQPRVYTRTTDGSVWESLPDGANGQTWNSYPLSSAIGAPSAIADPVVLVTPDDIPHVFTVDAAHHLWETKIDWRNGRTWNAYDLTATTPMPGVAGTPSAVVVNGVPRVYVRTDGNELWEVMPDGIGGWHAYDLTTASLGNTVLSDPSAVAANGVPRVYTMGPYGHLWETMVDGGGGRTWNSYDLTAAAPGPAIAGAPAAIAIGGSPRVYTTSTGTGDLLETLPDGRNGRTWNTYNLRSATGVPTAVGQLSVIAVDNLPRIYSRSPDGDLWETLVSGTWASYDLTTATAAPHVRSSPFAISLDNVPRVYAATVADPPPPPPPAPSVCAVPDSQGYDAGCADDSVLAPDDDPSVSLYDPDDAGGASAASAYSGHRYEIQVTGGGWTTIRNRYQSYAIGNAHDGWHIDAFGVKQGWRSGEISGDWSWNCGWVRVVNAVRATRQAPTDCGPDYRPLVSSFAAKVNCKACTYGTPVTLLPGAGEVHECANVLPMPAGQTKGCFTAIRTLTAAQVAAGYSVNWRYITKDNKYVMVNDTHNPSNAGRWVFIRRSAFPATLPTS